MRTDRYVIGVIAGDSDLLFYKIGNIGVRNADDAMIFESSDKAWKYVHKNGFHLHTGITIIVDMHPEDRYAD